MNQYSEHYLFKLNSKNEISNWVKRLKYFIFERAAGGHANDGDELTTSITFNSISQLEEICNKLEISLGNLQTENKNNIESNQLTTGIFLGHQIINDYRWGIHISNQSITLNALNSSPYMISNIDYEACKEFESKLEKYKLQHLIPIDILKERPRAITIERYSEYLE